MIRNSKIQYFTIIFLVTTIVYSQHVNYHNNYFQTYNFTSNGYTIKNNSSQSVKVIIEKKYNKKENYVLGSGEAQVLSFDEIHEFNNSNFDDNILLFVYDYECYENDIDKINLEIEKRLAAKRRNAFWNAVWQGYLEFSKEYGDDYILTPSNKNAEYLSQITSNFQKAQKFYKKHKKGETIEGLIDFLQDEVKPDYFGQVSEQINDKSFRTIVKELGVLNDYVHADLSIDMEPYVEKAINLQKLVSPYPFSSYVPNYKNDIQPVVDPDRDNLTNSKDRCHLIPGPVRYGKEILYTGCSDKEMKRLKKLKRKKERVINKLYVDANYSYSDYSFVDDMNYSGNLYNQSALINLTMPVKQFNLGNSKGAFAINGGMRIGTTYAKELDAGDDLNLFFDNTYTGGISFIYMTNRLPYKRRIIFQPTIGYLINTIPESSNLRWADSNSSVPTTLLLVEEQGKFYYDLTTRISFTKGNFDDLNYGLNLGARYQQNPIIIKNPSYNFNTIINGDEFEYPDNSLYLYGGIFMAF